MLPGGFPLTEKQRRGLQHTAHGTPRPWGHYWSESTTSGHGSIVRFQLRECLPAPQLTNRCSTHYTALGCFFSLAFKKCNSITELASFPSSTFRHRAVTVSPETPTARHTACRQAGRDLSVSSQPFPNCSSSTSLQSCNWAFLALARLLVPPVQGRGLLALTGGRAQHAQGHGGAQLRAGTEHGHCKRGSFQDSSTAL